RGSGLGWGDLAGPAMAAGGVQAGCGDPRRVGWSGALWPAAMRKGSGCAWWVWGFRVCPEVGQHDEDSAVRVGGAGQAEFADRLGYVRLDGAFGDEEPGRDRFVAEPFGDEAEYFQFAGGEGGERVRVSAASDETSHDARVDDRLAGGDAAQGVGDGGDLEHPLLQQISHAVRSVLDQAQRVAGLDVLRQEQHADRWQFLTDLFGGDESLVGERRRHPDVDDDGVW